MNTASRLLFTMFVAAALAGCAATPTRESTGQTFDSAWITSQVKSRLFADPATSGMRVSGRSPDGKFVEIAELPSHPWFVAVQFHPEFQSKPLRPHPLFASFVQAAHAHKRAALAPAEAVASRQPTAGSRQ